MSGQLEWSQKLGEAFLLQQGEVMETIQELRRQALAAGNLKSSSKQKVVVKSAAAETEHEGEYAGNATSQYVEIESANPRVVYVPVYDSTVVYGQYSYPTYSHYAYCSDGSAYAAGAYGYAAGVAVGASWYYYGGYSEGHWNWGKRSVNVNVDRSVNIKNSFNNGGRTANSNAQNPRQNAAGRFQAGKGGIPGRPNCLQHPAQTAARQGPAPASNGNRPRTSPPNAARRDGAPGRPGPVDSRGGHQPGPMAPEGMPRGGSNAPMGSLPGQMSNEGMRGGGMPREGMPNLGKGGMPPLPGGGTPSLPGGGMPPPARWRDAEATRWWNAALAFAALIKMAAVECTAGFAGGGRAA